MDIQDKKVLIDDSLWETIMGHDSGLVSRFPIQGLYYSSQKNTGKGTTWSFLYPIECYPIALSASL